MSQNFKRKSLLYLAVFDPHVPYTGTGARGSQFVNRLAARNTLDLVYMSGAGYPGDPDLEKKYEGNIENVRTKVRIPFSQAGYFLYSRAFYSRARALAKKNAYDVIIADYGLSALYGMKLAGKFGLPLVYCSHNIEYRQYLGKARKDPRRWPLVPYVYWIEKSGCKRAGLLMSISPVEADFFEKWVSPEKIVVIPQGFDENIYHPFYEKIPGSGKKVLFFGNYNISTNREAARVTREKIADRVAERFPDVEFQFIGANPPVDVQHPRMTFPGFVENLDGYIRSADVVISPVLAGWGMPTKIIEALACGKPVVATPVAARGVPPKYRRLRITGIESFAETVNEVLGQNDPVRTDDFEMLKEEYSWGGLVDRFERRIDMLLDSGSRIVTS